MAILVEVPGLKVVVVMGDDNCELKEYTNKDEEPILIERAKKTVYVESQVGRPFRIECHFDTNIFPYRKTAVMCEVQIDGRRVKKTFINAAHQRKYWLLSIKSLSVYEHDGHYVRPFVFAELPVSEEPDAGDNLRDPGQLGTISLRFKRCFKDERERTPKRERHKARGFEPIAEIAEKQLKGLSVCHQVEFGAVKKIMRDRKPRSVYLPYDTESFATFDFKYRDIRTLQSLGLTSDKSATPVDQNVSGIVKEEPLLGRNTPITETNVERQIEQMSREELAEALRMTRAQLHASEVGIKREQPDAGFVRASSEEPQVKRFRTASKIKVKGVEIIELSSDDD